MIECVQLGNKYWNQIVECSRDSLYTTEYTTEETISSGTDFTEGYSRYYTPIFDLIKEGKYEDAITLIDQVDREEIFQFVQKTRIAGIISDMGWDENDPIVRNYIERYERWCWNCINTSFDIMKAICCALNGQTKKAIEMYSCLTSTELLDLPTLLQSRRLLGGLFCLKDGDFVAAAAEFQNLKEAGAKFENMRLDVEDLLYLSLLQKKFGRKLFEPKSGQIPKHYEMILAGDFESAIQEIKKEKTFHYVINNEFLSIDIQFKELPSDNLALAAFCHAMRGEWPEADAKMKSAEKLDNGKYISIAQAAICLLKNDSDRAVEVERRFPIEEPNLVFLLVKSILSDRS
jgi:hypothetical protein